MTGPLFRWSLGVALAVQMGLAAPGARAQSDGAERPPVLVVSRSAILNETAAAKQLAAAEREMTARLQARVDAVKEELNAEEAELARLRSELGREAFDARVSAFDRRVRSERRAAQGQAAALQQAFRDARRRLVEELAPILEEVRLRHGALLIVDDASVLAAAREADVTAEVVTLFDQRVEMPVVRIPESTAEQAGAPPRKE